MDEARSKESDTRRVAEHQKNKGKKGKKK